MPLTLDEATGWRHSAATLKNTRGYDNQDAFALDGRTFVVADGVSKSDNPAAAARAVADFACAYKWEGAPRNAADHMLEVADDKAREAGGLTALFAASMAAFCLRSLLGIYRNAADHMLEVADDKAREAGGLTTMTGLRFLPRDPGEALRAVVFHVGDSMLLRVRGRRVDRLTTPHSVVEGLIKAKAITREEAKSHPWRNVITSALGNVKDKQVRLLDVRDSDALVLCTDGVHGLLSGADVLRCLAAEDPALALCEAGQAAGSSDDATAIVLFGPAYVSQTGEP